ncbi:MAG: ribbon-helix-helix protein, CopG family [Acidimicrobiales bacterium]
MNERIDGHRESGAPITDAVLEELADEDEDASGFDVEEIIARRGRPRLGEEPSTVESVRLDPELKELLVRRAQADGIAVSEVIRAALRRHLVAG